MENKLENVNSTWYIVVRFNCFISSLAKPSFGHSNLERVKALIRVENEYEKGRIVFESVFFRMRLVAVLGLHTF